MERSQDYGIHWTEVPAIWHDGDTDKECGCIRDDTHRQFASEWGVSDPRNYLNSYALLRPHASPTTASILFKRVYWFGEWVYKHWFKGKMGGLYMHPLDSTKLYCLGLWDSDDVEEGDPLIAYSNDSGDSWANKLGDWEEYVLAKSGGHLRFAAVAIRVDWSRG